MIQPFFFCFFSHEDGRQDEAAAAPERRAPRVGSRRHRPRRRQERDDDGDSRAKRFHDVVRVPVRSFVRVGFGYRGFVWIRMRLGLLVGWFNRQP